MTTGMFIFVLAFLALITLDLLALRFGADSRPRDGRPNWW
ncbi:MAG: hypothetical protein QOF01_470 [Thermomicrobiales bacterium]|jgi:hypothetical protein|nr:hypothetical protein [Thermomicrobiales bacterium]MEA2594001.1 hypothetical protein [Thermomicrobiales bacterium]